MEPIIAAQRAAEQAANDKKIQYFDLLDQRKETVEGLKLAALKGDADRVAAETARLRAVDAEIAKLQIGLVEKQAGQQLTGEQAMARTQADIDARAREGELNRASNERLERIRRATANQPGETERIEAEYARRRAIDPKDADAYLERIERIKGAGRTEGIAAQNANRAVTALENWRKETGKNIRMMNPKNPEAYANAEKQEIARIKQVYGVDLSVPSAGAPTTTKSGATVSNWN
jgi:hypothetical protein